ncbi:hypothetical protein SAY87_013683 [Trapa incisa]|uniref:Late embryogenesis abundant protein LEA-2 subgroup domain-containing protein n=2 Tax=Trapa TaxID=22665 RepID=A0AAN7K7W8_TRANT|nr:hypothetical protein SAY86_008098 [Trapa natans]KAK4764245.1 hypothetical protein SAY87_013683 [Trapa incisa]
MAENFRPPTTGYPVPPSGAYTNGYPSAASNTAYPYAAPAPQYSNYQYYGQPQQQYPRRSSFIRYFLVAMIAFFVITGCIFFIVWLVLRPRIPEFSVQSVKVSNFSVVDTMRVSGTWQVGLLAANPNKKMKISYDNINAGLYYKSEFITITRIPPFDQGTRNQTALDVFFSADNAYVITRAVNELNSDRAKGNVAFQIKGMAWVRFSSGWWRVRRRELRFWCVDLAVGLSSSSNGTANLVGAQRNCKVSI